MRCNYVSQNNSEKADRSPHRQSRENMLPLQRDARVPWRAVLLAKSGNLPDFHAPGVEGEKGEVRIKW